MIKKHLVFWIILFSFLRMSVVFGETPEVQIATIWNAPTALNPDGTHTIDFEQASKVIQWQRTGFLAGLRDAPGDIKINEVLISEKDNLSRATVDLADLYNSNDIIMTIGASSEIDTMYAAMVTTFFKIPILVPFSDGELFSESDQGFTMRITPTGQKYADYFGTKLFPADLEQRINMVLFENKPVPEYSVKAAVFFADDFNDHESAVKITQQLMDNGIDICYYKPYEPKQLLQAVRTAWEKDANDVRDADAVIIIPQDKDTLLELASVIGMWGDQEVPPAFLLIGYVPEYPDQTTFSSENVYVVREAIDRSQCPPDVIHHEGAMGYAAGYIAKLALSRAAEKTPPEIKGWRLWLRTPEQKVLLHQRYLSSMRTAVVTALRDMTDYIPCFGQASFLSVNEDLTELKLIRYVGVDQAQPVDDSEVFYRIVNRIRSRFGITEW